MSHQKPEEMHTDHAAVGSSEPLKKKRGRPRGSVNKPRVVKEPSVLLTTHIMDVKAGECLATKIMSLSLDDHSNVCMLAGKGAISRVTLRQPSSGSVTYEGHFKILTLGGSLLLADNSDPSSRSGGLTATLSGPDGQFIGGKVVCEMIAASPVQAVLVSFPAEYYNGSE